MVIHDFVSEFVLKQIMLKGPKRVSRQYITVTVNRSLILFVECFRKCSKFHFSKKHKTVSYLEITQEYFKKTFS
jgi:hypothetical protein